MNTITRDALKAKLDRHEPLQLVMALGRWAWEQARIPGSLNFATYTDALARLSKDEEVVVYCTNPSCPASYRLYHYLKSQGFTKVSRYSGGIEEWAEAGLPVEGKQAARYPTPVAPRLTAQFAWSPA